MAESDPVPEYDIHAKVLQYEQFLNERLRPDLKHVLDAESQVCDQISNCDQVCVFLDQIKNKSFGAGNELKVQTDLGCNFFCEAVV